MPKLPTKEETEVRELLRSLNFHCSNIDPKIMKGFKDIESPIIWMPIGIYSLTEQVLKKMVLQGLEPVGPFEFISAVSRLKKIHPVKVCLFQIDNLRGALIAVEEIQRTISAIFAGDGWGSNCEFAVKPKSA